MMLDYSFNLKKESELINKAVEDSLVKKHSTPDISLTNKSYSTVEVGDYIVEFIQNS